MQFLPRVFYFFGVATTRESAVDLFAITSRNEENTTKERWVRWADFLWKKCNVSCMCRLAFLRLAECGVMIFIRLNSRKWPKFVLARCSGFAGASQAC